MAPQRITPALPKLFSNKEVPAKPKEASPKEIGSMASTASSAEPAPVRVAAQPAPTKLSVPHELPPAFVPSSAAMQPPQFHSPQFPVMFGGYPDSSSASPAPPSGGYMGCGPMAPPPPSDFSMGQFMPGPPGFPLPFHNHAHGPHAAPWFPPQHMPYGMPPPHPYQQFNGHHMDGGTPISRSTSHTSRDGDGDGGPPPLSHNIHNMNAPNGHANGTPVFLPPPMHPNHDFIPIQDWLARRFSSKRFADYRLEVTHPAGVTSLDVHALLVARSPLLENLIADAAERPKEYSGERDAGLPALRVVVTEPYVTDAGIKDVLRNLYTGYLPNIQKILSGLPPFDTNTRTYTSIPRDRMKDAVGYAIFGGLLGLPQVENHGLEMIRALLRLDTVELPLAAALTNTGSDVQPLLPFRRRLLNLVMHFLISHFPSDFALDTMAPPLAELPRLPHTAAHRPSTSAARLSRIQFGDLPSHPRDAVFTLYSSILLSLPFEPLNELLTHPALAAALGSHKVVSLMHEVVAEREAQRLKAKSKVSVQELDIEMWAGVFFEEKVHQLSPSSASLARSWVLSSPPPPTRALYESLRSG